MAANKGLLPAGKRLVAFKSGDAIQYNVRNAVGQNRAAWGIWEAQNKRRGAALNYYVNFQKGDSALKSLDSVNVRIYNDKNELVRSLKYKADSGMNVRHWELEQNGFRTAAPSRFTNTATTPGLPVLSGNYKVVYSLGNSSDSTMLTVKDDPIAGNNNEEKIADKLIPEAMQYYRG